MFFTVERIYSRTLGSVPIFGYPPYANMVRHKSNQILQVRCNFLQGPLLPAGPRGREGAKKFL